MFRWQVSNGTSLKYGQTSLLISCACWTWCQSHIHVMSLLQPTTTTPMMSPTTSTHRPTTIHVCFPTTLTPCNATWSPLGDTIPAIQEWQQWPNKIPWPRNNGNKDVWSIQQPQTTTSAHENHTRPRLDARTQLKRHNWCRLRTLFRRRAPSMSPNSKRKAVMPKS